jgi:hypothetical protein
MKGVSSAEELKIPVKNKVIKLIKSYVVVGIHNSITKTFLLFLHNNKLTI